MNGLPILVRTAGRTILLIGTGEPADAKRRLLERTGAHWAGWYPAGRRPRSVHEGATMFLARLVTAHGVGDIAVFGRATALAYVEGRDDATPEDLARRPWKARWPHCIRVRDAEFVAGTLADGTVCEALDLTDLDAIDALIARVAPDIVVNATAHTAVDRAESEPELAHRINAQAPARIAAACAARGGFEDESAHLSRQPRLRRASPISYYAVGAALAALQAAGLEPAAAPTADFSSSSPVPRVACTGKTGTPSRSGRRPRRHRSRCRPPRPWRRRPPPSGSA